MKKWVEVFLGPVGLVQFVMLVNKWTGLYADKGWDWVLFPIITYCIVYATVACLESLVKE